MRFCNRVLLAFPLRQRQGVFHKHLFVKHELCFGFNYLTRGLWCYPLPITTEPNELMSRPGRAAEGVASIPYRLNPAHSGRLPAELTGHSMSHSPIRIGLIFFLTLLLGVQLTGLTCLDEWQGAIYSAQAEIMDNSQSPEGNVLDHGCPCHFVFQSVILAVPEPLSLHTDDVNSIPSLYVPSFVVFLFRPPLNV